MKVQAFCLFFDLEGSERQVIVLMLHSERDKDIKLFIYPRLLRVCWLWLD